MTTIEFVNENIGLLPKEEQLNVVNYIKNLIDKKRSKKVKSKRLQIIKNIIAFKSLNENWDGYGALPLELESAMNAVTIVDFLTEKHLQKVSDYYPNPHGTITFEWENEHEEIINLEIGNVKMSYFVKRNHHNTIMKDNIEIIEKSIIELTQFIEQL